MRSSTETSGKEQAGLNGSTGPEAVPRLVQRLHKVAQDVETVSLGHLAKEIGAQGHAPLLMVVAILMILPIGMIPGIGGALGILVAIIGFQMLLGRQGVWLPKFLARREILASHICSLTHRIRPAAGWIRRHLHPRWAILSENYVSLSIVAVILILTGGSLTILGAIPIAAPLVGLPVAVFAFGILGRDGMVVALGYALIVVIFATTWLMARAWN